MLLVGAGAAGSGGCSPKRRTEAIIGIATDLRAPVPLATIHLRVIRLPELVEVFQNDFNITGRVGDGYELPSSFGIYSEKGDSYRVRVIARAFDNDGKELVTRTAVLSLVPQRTVYLRLGLVSACVGKLDCSEGTTCIEGRCESEAIDAHRLPDYSVEVAAEATCTGGTMFRNTSTGEALATGTGCTGAQSTCQEGVCLAPPIAEPDAGADVPGGGATGGAGGEAGTGGTAGAPGSGGRAGGAGGGTGGAAGDAGRGSGGGGGIVGGGTGGAISTGTGGSPGPGTGGNIAPGAGGRGGSAGAGGARGTGGAGGGAAGSGGVPAGTGGDVGGATGGASGTGGDTGTGGAPGSGGDGGGGSGGGRPGTGGAGTGGSGAGASTFLVESFESGTIGQQPTGWDSFISYVKNGANPQGATLALVDDTRAHGGTKSIHFHGGSSPAQITRPLPAQTNKVYVRAWVYMTRQLGMNPGANHESLLGLRKVSGSASDEVRFGEIKGTIGTNEVPSDDLSPLAAQWGLGPVVPANQWACIEVAFLGDQPQHLLYAWADGALVHSITASDQWQNGSMPMNWLEGKFVEVFLGWQSFSSSTIDVWMDDIALGTDRIGCN